MTMDYPQQIAAQINIRTQQASATIELLDQGNTLPFIARYRKEATGGLDEEQIRQLAQLLHKLRSLDERRQTILHSIEEQGLLTPELHQQILEAQTPTRLEDLYQPYKPKRRTRASAAREAGLQGLADLILQQVLSKDSLQELAKPYLNEHIPVLSKLLRVLAISLPRPLASIRKFARMYVKKPCSGVVYKAKRLKMLRIQNRSIKSITNTRPELTVCVLIKS
jgi:protein Tex